MTENRLKQMNERKVASAVPRERQKLLKWNGWGYNDSKFIVDDDMAITFVGDR